MNKATEYQLKMQQAFRKRFGKEDYRDYDKHRRLKLKWTFGWAFSLTEEDKGAGETTRFIVESASRLAEKLGLGKIHYCRSPTREGFLRMNWCIGFSILIPQDENWVLPRKKPINRNQKIVLKRLSEFPDVVIYPHAGSPEGTIKTHIIVRVSNPDWSNLIGKVHDLALDLGCEVTPFNNGSYEGAGLSVTVPANVTGST
jgi:hypothetical protein